MEGIQVSVEKVGAQGDCSVIRVGGYIDTTTSAELERALDSLLKTGVVHIIIDLGNVDYISSAGWGIFISEIKGIREKGGDLKLARMIPDVFEVFELLEFHYILKAYDTVEEALNDFGFGGETYAKIERTKAEEPLGIRDPVIRKVEEYESIPDGLEDKIKQIIMDHPSFGPSQISRELDTEKYGFIRLGTISLWRMLRKLNLGSKKQRENLAKIRNSMED
jgi:anti-sigma B factor antagonist